MILCIILGLVALVLVGPYVLGFLMRPYLTPAKVGSYDPDYLV